MGVRCPSLGAHPLSALWNSLLSTHNTAPDADEEFGLIVEQAGVRPDLVKQLGLILNYVYGFNTMLARSPMEAASLLAERGQAVVHVFVLGVTELPAAAVSRLTDGGRLPLFLLVPNRLYEEACSLAGEVGGSVTVIDIDEIPEHGGAVLRTQIDPVFHEQGIGALFDRAQHVSFRILQQRVEKRLRHLHTLPTLPEVVMRIMEVVADPDSSPEELEEVLRSDPATVHKLLQVVNTPAFAGAGQKGEWSLHDAIVRLGRRKLASVALQIKLINSLIKPEESGFDLRRFWIHSVGTAHIADKLYQAKMVDVDDEEVDVAQHYWVAALLHDIGKLILGFFFWEHFERLASMSSASDLQFHDAEEQLGDLVNHEQLGQLLLMRGRMAETLVKCVGGHHDPGTVPDGLMALVHVADNLCKDLGLGYAAGESGLYDSNVLRVLGLNQERIVELRQSLEGETVEEIMDIAERCTSN